MVLTLVLRPGSLDSCAVNQRCSLPPAACSLFYARQASARHSCLGRRLDLIERKRPLDALPCWLDVMLCGEPLVEPEADAFDVPGQELCDAVDGMIGDALDHVSQIGL